MHLLPEPLGATDAAGSRDDHRFLHLGSLQKGLDAILCAGASRDPSRQAELCPPHVWIYTGLIEAIVTEGDKAGLKDATIVKEHLQQDQDYDLDLKCDVVKLCRRAPMYNRDFVKNLLSVPHEASRSVALEPLGAIRKFGRAPASGLERPAVEQGDVGRVFWTSPGAATGARVETRPRWGTAL